MKIMRNTDEWVGLLVILSVVVFVAAALHAGLLSDWFRPTAKLRIMLPPSGSGGLAPGADIEVLGTRVGNVRRIVVNADAPMYAEAELEVPATGYIRRDSVALIKKSFGVAGAAYLDIARGSGEKLDWKFAVIDASTERAATDDINNMIDDLKKKIYPILDDAGRGMKALADTLEAVGQGQGNIGRFMKGDEVANQVAALLANLVTATNELNATVSDIRAFTNSASQTEGVPALLRRADSAMASVQQATRDLALTTGQLPAITRNVATSTSSLPALLTQTQQTMVDLQKLLNQLRNTWPLAGSAAADPRRLAPREVRP